VAIDGRRHVVSFGGLPWRDSGPVERGPFRDYLCGLTGRAGPRIAVLTTASGDDPAGAALTCAWFEGGGAEVSHVALFPMPSVADPEDFLLSRDLIFVGGGSVRTCSRCGASTSLTASCAPPGRPGWCCPA
jgi:hypothetical protein